MSVTSRAYEPGLEGELSAPFKKLFKSIKGLFVNKEISRFARLYHMDFSYGLIPNTAVSDFANISKITSLYSGDCYVYLFQQAHYQGWYRIVGPGERIETDQCESLIVSLNPISLDEVQRTARAPEFCWEMSGPMYLMHFYAAYRYA
ncbi:MAG: hypothetical protein JL50_18715 [Peptococcaceae bacterium BICA1-7]|nr:MAG: hypothetical protein JL50_18715 [Peptococcaceae bacterium BICA1-7]HBV99031.1 hypothetical protein [Desulfotomaculum sp.]